MFKKITVLLICVLSMSNIVLGQDKNSRELYEKMLQESQPNDKKYSYLYDTSLIQSIKRQDEERVNFLLLANVNPNEPNDEDEIPLVIACQYPSDEIVIKLLDRGAAVDGRAKYGITPLMAAAAKGDGRKVNILMEYGANPNLQDEMGKTALMHGVENLNFDSVSTLLELRKLDLSLADKKGKTAFIYALESKNSDMLVLFLQKGIKVDKRDKNAQKLFLKSVKNSDMNTAHMLLGYGLTFESDDPDGQKALVNAVKANKLDEVELLLAAGISPNTRDSAGTPVLIYAVKKNNIEMAQLLLDNGANPSIRDYKGNWPLTYAINNKNDEMRALLESYGAQSKETYGIDFSKWGTEEIRNYIERAEYNLRLAKNELAKREGRTVTPRVTSKNTVVKKSATRPSAKQTGSKKVTKSTRVTKSNDGTTTTTETNTIIVTQEQKDAAQQGQQDYAQPSTQGNYGQETYRQESYTTHESYGQAPEPANYGQGTTTYSQETHTTQESYGQAPQATGNYGEGTTTYSHESYSSSSSSQGYAQQAQDTNTGNPYAMPQEQDYTPSTNNTGSSSYQTTTTTTTTTYEGEEDTNPYAF